MCVCAHTVYLCVYLWGIVEKNKSQRRYQGYYDSQPGSVMLVSPGRGAGCGLLGQEGCGLLGH